MKKVAQLLLLGISLLGVLHSTVDAETNVKLLKTPNDGIQPKVVVDASGTVHLVYYKGDAQSGNLYYVRKDSGGDFASPLRINSVPDSSVAMGTIRGAQFAVDKHKRIHVVWNGSKNTQPENHHGPPMFYARLKEDGSGFEEQRIISGDWSVDGGGAVAVDASGRVFIFWHSGEKLGVRLITGARVKRLETNSNGLVTGAHYVDREGKAFFQKAGVTVVCANGIGTPRLLQLSANSKFPDGLANSSGLVGRRLMMHPFGTVVGLFEEDLGSSHGFWGQNLHSLEFYETDADRGFVRGAKWGLQPTGGPLSMTRAYPWGAENSIWGDSFHRDLQHRLNHSAMWGIIAEDLPEEENRVVLDPVLTDSDGIPAPKIIYRMSENSERLMQFHLKRAKESLEAAGASETVVAPLIRETGWHLLGTAKMGSDPGNSVVDPWGRCHDIPNLFIFDGSTWPTSSGMNPTATIAAMALRCAEHLVEQRHHQHVPS
ncbi:MAG: GMC family oxidoreductase [Verrucomicrobia bacterium]|nr:GMC family oxidoreductase [Verrucomicrobiota bacterium]